MKQLLLFWIIFLFEIVPVTAQSFISIDSLISDRLNSEYNGNCVIMVRHNDSLSFYKNYGSYDSSTVKGIASLTKTFSGIVILKLLQERLINLDDSIGLYIPYTTSMGKGSSTIRENFSHTAGWDGITGNTYLTDPSLSLSECVDSIIKYDPLIYKPGSMFKYTGVSMQVAARAAEIAAGDNWNNLWSKKIKKTLALNSTQFGFQNNPRVAGGLASSPADIIRLAQFILNNGKLSDGNQLIDSVLIEELWKDQTKKAPVIAMPYPFNPPYNNPYNADTIRYGIGTWLDIYNPQTNSQEQISGGGAFGSIMWVNRCNNTCGVIFTYSSYSKVWETSFKVIDMVNKIYPNVCITSSLMETEFMPDKFQLEQNYPNPFNPSANIRYQIPTAGYVSLKVYDVLGREVATLVDEFKHPGNYSSSFSVFNSSFSSGVYFYQLKVTNHSAGTAQAYIETKKMMFLK